MTALLSPPPRFDSHDSGRPSAAAQIRDQLAARWLDLTVQRAGGLSTEVRRLPLRRRFYTSSVSRFFDLHVCFFVESSGCLIRNWFMQMGLWQNKKKTVHRDNLCACQKGATHMISQCVCLWCRSLFFFSFLKTTAPLRFYVLLLWHFFPYCGSVLFSLSLSRHQIW